jgi:hypothetical protein
LTDPAAVFLRQVDAFNARRLEDFLATYAADAEVHGLDVGHVVVGHAALRPVYARRFGQRPLHCEVLQLEVLGERWAVAHERVTSPGGASDLVAIFEVVDGLIVRVDLSGRVPVQA